MTIRIERPTDDYDPAWLEYWAAHPGTLRAVGADAAAAAGEGEGEGEGAGEGEGEGEGAGAGEGEDAGEGEGEGKGKAKSKAEPNWRDPITDPDMKKFAERFTDPADAVKAAHDLRGKLAKRAEPPGEDASDEQIAEWRAATGVPETPEGYEIDLPDETPEDVAPSKEDLQPFLAGMHEAGATPAVAQAAIDYFYGTYLPEGQKVLAEQEAAAGKKATEALEKEWPTEEEFNENVVYAQRAASHFGGPGFTKFLNESKVAGLPMAKHPDFLRAFAKIGRRISEKGIQIGMTDEETKDSEGKVDELGEQAYAARQKGNIKESDRLYAERDALSRKIWGTEGVVGSSGRAL